jgi:pyridoxal phosphate-dependent aminotransferase EpsN
MSRLYLSPPDLGPTEAKMVLAALESGWPAPVGPDLGLLEAEVAAVAGVSSAVALASGSAALHLALLGVGVGVGDDVLVSSFTFAATANAVTYCGATPSFIDSDSTTWNMSPKLLADELAERRRTHRLPAAIVSVDLYGQCADYTAIVPLCDEFDIPLIEDAAEAIGARHAGQPAGSFGQAAVFSFNGNKIITSGGGGMLVSNDVALIDRARYLSSQARQPVEHYEHTEVGYNYRLSNLLAALGRAQLSRLDGFIERRHAISDLYRSQLADVAGVSFMPLVSADDWNGWLTCILLDDAAQSTPVRIALAEADIEARPLWKPLHLQAAFAGCSRRTDGTSERLFAHGTCLPSGSALTDQDVRRVCDIIRATVRASR